MNVVDIIYDKYLSDEKVVTIGGIQTYISDLCSLLSEKNVTIRVIQFARKDYVHKLPNGVSVYGFKIPNLSSTKRYQLLYDSAVKSRDYNRSTLTIFATDTIIPRKVSGYCIAIQHGIFWDIPRNVNRSLIRQVIGRAIFAYRILSRLNRVNEVVCVDYNFLNWYRTQLNHISNYIYVIPNYTHIAPKIEKENKNLNIIFARRLFAYRGTRIFSAAISRILDEYENITVTIAGSGEDELWMRDKLERYKNVIFTSYESWESLDIHKNMHIAVVPTVGSEGTSLSLLEAMSAQCAVICSNVGGMTNIVIDGYNGLMINSGSIEQLYDALKYLIDNEDRRHSISQHGYQTVRDGFSIEKWQEQWRNVLSEAGDKSFFCS